MKMTSFRIAHRDELPSCLDAFKAQCPENPATLFVTVFSGWPDEQKVLELVSQVRREFPKATVLGCSAAGEIVAGGMALNTAVVTFMTFTETVLQLHCIDFTKSTADKDINSFIDNYKNAEDLAGVEVLFSTNDNNTYKFISSLNQLPHAIPIFGGVAASEENEKSYVVINNRVIHDGVVAACYIGHDTHIQIHASQGWSPLGPWFTITDMTAENIIAKLDNKPASLIYEKYLDISQDEFEQENLVFPLFLERNGQRILRHPACTTNDGKIVLHGDCRTGEKVRLAYGDPGKILEALHGVHKKIIDFDPQGIIIFNCSSRRFFFMDDANHELHKFNDIAVNAGCYTAGELGRTNNNDVSLRNMTFVAVSIREGAKRQQSNPETSAHTPSKPLTGAMKLVRHLAHFIAVTSEELEESNRRLADLATMDTLTGLYNRGEIESILQKELSTRRQGQHKLSAVMLDLDNFKMINDSYGHSIGDQVLCGAGAAMKRNIRRSDAAGRWGGEEFFIILPDTAMPTALKIAERIRQDIQAKCTLPDGKRVTASIGVAEYSEDCSYMDFYRLLDAALYRAKRLGKNTVCSADIEDLHDA